MRVPYLHVLLISTQDKFVKEGGLLAFSFSYVGYNEVLYTTSYSKLFKHSCIHPRYCNTLTDVI